MFANNEIGTIQPIKEIGEIAKANGILFHTDAVQAFGQVPINVDELNIDMLSSSGHKLNGPKGIGFLYIRKGVKIRSFVHGGGQERKRRAGTENVPYIVGLGVAAEKAKQALEYEVTEIKRLRDKLETGILKNIYNARLNSSISNRVANTSNIGFEYIEGELILLHLSDIGICASSGSACTSGALEPSHVLRAMGVPFTSLHGSIRFSLSRYTTEAEIDYTLEKLPQVIEKITQLSPYQDELNQLKNRKQ